MPITARRCSQDSAVTNAMATSAKEAAPARSLRPSPFRTALIAYVRHPSGSMPPYTSKVASDAELADIRAFLASVPAPPPLKSIPLLNQ